VEKLAAVEYVFGHRLTPVIGEIVTLRVVLFYWIPAYAGMTVGSGDKPDYWFCPGIFSPGIINHVSGITVIPADACMNAGGRATHGAKAEAGIQSKKPP
jgi:hypothetical protein